MKPSRARHRFSWSMICVSRSLSHGRVARCQGRRRSVKRKQKRVVLSALGVWPDGHWEIVHWKVAEGERADTWTAFWRTLPQGHHGHYGFGGQRRRQRLGECSGSASLWRGPPTCILYTRGHRPPRSPAGLAVPASRAMPGSSSFSPQCVTLLLLPLSRVAAAARVMPASGEGHSPRAALALADARSRSGRGLCPSHSEWPL